MPNNPMTTVVHAACVAVLVATAASCSRADAPAPAAGAAAEQAAPLPPAATVHPDDLADVTASYDCNGIRVDIVRDEVARVNLGADNIVKIERLAGSTPPTYQDVGLTLTTSATGANLDDESGQGIACQAVAAPR